jgi:transcriptional regulator with XRE-family HTH domain
MSSLEDVASAADAVADDQRRLARLARSLQQLRDRGSSWADILDRQDGAELLRLLRGSAQRLVATLGSLARTVAHSLAAEGHSRRQIGRRLGVSHQRVSALLASKDRPDDATGP